MIVNIIVVSYLVQISVCRIILGLQANPPHQLDLFQTKKQFLISTFVPLYWLYRMIKDWFKPNNYHSLK